MTGRKVRRAAATISMAAASVTMAACGSEGSTAPAHLLGATATPVPRVTSLAQLNQGLATPGPLACNPTIAQVGNPKSHLVFSGPCTFTEVAGVSCVRKIDDFYVYIRHELPDNGSLVININVEKYKGPGDYTNATQVNMEVARGINLYPWAQLTTSSTVDEDGRHVHLQATDVPPQAGSSALETEHVEGDVYCAN